ncbi:MAG TPA: YceI family protein [Vicinamibacterales bacterium]|nr:YceI family protein [Acidobacteriota bacterium]HOC18938.1 YceI family protein [Vicinamibacterales bacterium]
MSTTIATTTDKTTYSIDKAHSEVSFQVRHLLTRVRGRFSDFDGTIAYDEAAPEQSSVRLEIRTASIDTNEPARDKHLRSDDFFAADRFPAITFASTKMVKKGEDAFEVTGNLTIRDVTKEITLPVTFLGKAKDPWGNERLAFEVEYALNRKDYGLNWNAALETGGFLVGDEVKISVAVQAVPRT